MADCSRSPSQQNGWYAAVCLCQSQWPQRTRWWWRRWGWTRWCRCRIAPSFSLAGWTSSAAAGSTSSVGLFWWGSWCWAPTWGPGRWWCPGSGRTPQCRLGSLSGWWGWVGLGSSWNLQPSPLFSEHWAPGCSVHTRSPDGRFPTCRRTHPHQRWAQWGWCRPRTWGVWRTGAWRCSCWCTGRRVEGKEHSLEGNRCLWSWNPRHASPASRVASCRTVQILCRCFLSLPAFNPQVSLSRAQTSSEAQQFNFIHYLKALYIEGRDPENYRETQQFPQRAALWRLWRE